MKAELKEKYDAMMAFGTTIDEAIAAGNEFDKMPIGFGDLFNTFCNVQWVIFSDPEITDKDALLRKACEDYADILIKLKNLTDSLLGSSDAMKKEAGEQWLNAMKQEKGLKMADKEEIAPVVAPVETAEAVAPAQEAAAPAEASTEAPAEATPVAEPTAEAPAAQPEAQEDAPVAPAEPEAAPAEEPKAEEAKSEVNEIAELREQMKSMQATIAELTSKAEQAKDSGAELEASPTKKSEMFDNSGCASEEDTKKAEEIQAQKAERLRDDLCGYFGF